MSVQLSTTSLSLQRPLTRSIKKSVTITNREEGAVLFKVKTTAPKRYCVKPNAGTIPAGASTVVSIIFQALDEELPISAKCKDKFLIQSVFVGDVVGEAADLWPRFEAAAKSGTGGDIHEHKIRCVYAPSEATGTHPPPVAGARAATTTILEEGTPSKYADDDDIGSPTADDTTHFDAADETLGLSRGVGYASGSPSPQVPPVPALPADAAAARLKQAEEEIASLRADLSKTTFDRDSLLKTNIELRKKAKAGSSPFLFIVVALLAYLAYLYYTRTAAVGGAAPAGVTPKVIANPKVGL